MTFLMLEEEEIHSIYWEMSCHYQCQIFRLVSTPHGGG